MTYIRTFDSLEDGDFKHAGGKASSLIKLRRAGFPVPDGFILLSTAFDAAFEATGIGLDVYRMMDRLVSGNTLELVQTAGAIQAMITNIELPLDIVAELKRQASLLRGSHIAIRSSATVEDSETHAWAGQLDTFLNTSPSELILYVKRCWASLFSPRAIRYQQQAGSRARDTAVAVVVQNMVMSEISGVSFSTHPNRPEDSLILVEACLGLGEALVSGQITPSSYCIDRHSRAVVERREEIQARALYPTVGAEAGTTWKEVVQSANLSDSTISELVDLTLRVERHMGNPCDVEWACQDGSLKLLQARPITTLAHSRDATPLFTKAFARDFSLPSLEIAYRCESSLTKEWMPARERPYLLHLAFERADGTVYVWYNRKSLAWTKDNLRRIVEQREDFLDQIETRVLSGIARIAPLYENPRPISRDALQCFIRDYMKVYDWLEALWALAGITDEELGRRNTLSRVRERTDKLSSGADTVIRQSLKMIYLDLGELSSVIGLDEFESGAIPSREVLKLRLSRFIYLDGRIYPDMVKEQASELFDIRFEEELLPEDTSLITGTTGAAGKAQGVVCRVMGHGDFGKIREGQVLVSPMTMPDFIREMDRAVAFVTDEGGATCHAAIIAREKGKPCVVGTKYATRVLNDGDLVEVDADRGFVRLIR